VKVPAHTVFFTGWGDRPGQFFDDAPVMGRGLALGLLQQQLARWLESGAATGAFFGLPERSMPSP